MAQTHNSCKSKSSISLFETFDSTNRCESHTQQATINTLHKICNEDIVLNMAHFVVASSEEILHFETIMPDIARYITFFVNCKVDSSTDTKQCMPYSAKGEESLNISSHVVKTDMIDIFDYPALYDFDGFPISPFDIGDFDLDTFDVDNYEITDSDIYSDEKVTQVDIESLQSLNASSLQKLFSNEYYNVFEVEFPQPGYNSESTIPISEISSCSIWYDVITETDITDFEISNITLYDVITERDISNFEYVVFDQLYDVITETDVLNFEFADITVFDVITQRDISTFEYVDFDKVYDVITPADILGFEMPNRIVLFDVIEPIDMSNFETNLIEPRQSLIDELNISSLTEHDISVLNTFDMRASDTPNDVEKFEHENVTTCSNCSTRVNNHDCYTLSCKNQKTAKLYYLNESISNIKKSFAKHLHNKTISSFLSNCKNSEFPKKKMIKMKRLTQRFKRFFKLFISC